MKKRGDRQPDPSSIARDHTERYHWAKANIEANKVKVVLDAACGIGYGSAIMLGVAKVTGVDISEGAILDAKRHFKGPRFEIGDIQRGEWSDGDYGAITCFEAIEHIKEPIQALGWMRKTLGMKGILYCSVPHELDFPFNEADWTTHSYPHLTHYTVGTFAELLTKAGFTDLSFWAQKSKADVQVRKGPFGRNLIVAAMA
jgi:2-polyprenyl-3-methyl-5-hydroxy-6-metoxy-1,4-benzoquinol methylase